MRKTMMAFGLALVLMACRAEKSMETSGSDGLTTVYELRDFTGVHAGGAVHVQFTQGENYSVEVDESTDPDLVTKVEKRGSTLFISTEQKKKGATAWKGDSPLVRITAPRMESIELNGASTLQASKLKGEQLHLDVSGASKAETGLLEYGRVEAKCTGASKVTASIKAEDISLDCSGASKLTLNAEGKTMKATNSGASKCDLTFVGGDVDFRNSGAGKVDLKVVDCKELKASNSGASKFVISGNADKTTIDASGVAKIDTSRLNQY